MSASAEGSASTTKAITSDPTNSTSLKDEQKPAAALEEDDEFEDFPVEGTAILLLHVHSCKQGLGLTEGLRSIDWPAEDQEVPPGEGGTTHLWEESWDDDDTSEDFSKQLKWVILFVG